MMNFGVRCNSLVGCLFLLLCWCGSVNAGETGLLEPREIDGKTPISGVTITAWFPEEFEESLVRRVEDSLQRRGAKLKRATDDADLVDLLRHGPVLAFGDAWNNGAVRRLYYEMFDWTDAAWPSRGGYAVRTIVDPYATGHDVIRVAYSVDEDARRAVEAFLTALEASRGEDGLGYLHVVKLGELKPVYDRYLNPLLSPEFRWQHEDNTWDLQVQSSHLGVGYLLTGREEFLVEFRRRLLRYLEHNSDRGWRGSHGFMHHLTLPYFLTEHHSVWSLGDRRLSLMKIREVFLSGDGIRYGGFVAGTRSDRPRDNHSTRAALDNFVHARYLARYHELPEAKQGLALVERFFRWQFSSAKPLEDSNGHQFKASMINTMSYALATRNRTMIESQTLRRAADRAEMQMNNRGFGALFSGPGASGFSPVTLLSMAAAVYGEPRYYRSIALGEPDAGTKGEVPLAALVLPYRHGDEFLRAFATMGSIPRSDGRDSALSVAELDEAYRGAVPEVPRLGFDKLAFRGGFARQGEYLLLDGMSGGHHAYENANCVLEMGVGGHTWLGAVDWGDRNSSVRNQNGVQVLRDGLSSGGRRQFAELLGIARSGDVTISATLLDDPSGQSPWRRWVVHRRGHLFAIFDDVSLPERPSEELALIQSRWFLHGRVEVRERSLKCFQGTSGQPRWLCATVLGEGAVADDPIDVSRSFWAWQEACGKWLFQDMAFRHDFPIDPASTPSTITRLSVSQAQPGGPARRAIGGLLLTWGTGDCQVPDVTTGGPGQFSIGPNHNELVAVFDESGLAVRTQQTQVRLDLPEDRRADATISDRESILPIDVQDVNPHQTYDF